MEKSPWKTSETDYIFTDKKYTVTDCAVINSFNF